MAAGIPRGARQPLRESAVQQLEDEIAQLEDSLRQAFSKLADLYNGHIPSTRKSPSSRTTKAAHDQPTHVPTLTSSTSLNTAAVSSSIATLLPSVNSATSRLSLIAASTTAGLPSSVTDPATQSIDSTTDATPGSSSSSNTSTAPTSASSTVPLRTGSSTVSIFPSASANSSSNANFTMSSTGCSSLCSSLDFPSSLSVDPISCVSYAANDTITIEGGQATATCGSTITPSIDLCRVVLSITTSEESEVYVEVWLPDGDSTWNGRTMSTDNSGVNGCVAFDDMDYVTGMGFAAIGDNGGHNSSSFDGSWFQGSNELVLDWAGRARHASVVAGKAVVSQFYNRDASYSYYIGCSAGGWQGLKSAQDYPNDFDGIIAGSSATDFNHLQAWSGRFVQLTGEDESDDRFLTEDDWITVQSAIFAQCDAAIDGVDDGILEDPTICDFDTSVLSNSTYGLTDTQVTTVYNVFMELYNSDGNLLFPALLYGSQVDAFRLGQLSGSVQAISEDWYKYAVLNDSSWNALDMDQSDYARADELDAYHGNVSGYDGDLSGFSAAGGKLIMYHGMADPLVSEGVAQRYYLKVASTLGISNDGMDDFMRLFRISGMAHCGVGGISGAGAWMFGQNEDASAASTNIIDVLQDWVERDSAPDTLTGTKFWYDTPSLGVEFQRNHCRFPYRTTYVGDGADYTLPGAWNCTFIDDWQDCGVGAHPRLCNVDGSFDP